MVLALAIPLMAQEAESKDVTKDVKVVIREKHDRSLISLHDSIHRQKEKLLLQ